MVSMSGKQLRVQHIFPDYDDTLSFTNNRVDRNFSTIVNVVDEEDFVPDYTYLSLYSVDIDDSRVTVRFINDATWAAADINGFGLHDINSEISDFSVDDVRVISEDVPDGMEVYTDASPLEGSDVFLWNFVDDLSADSSFSNGSEFIIDFVSEDPVLSNFAVKPGDDEIPSLSTKSKGVTPMALYGSEDFDAMSVDPTSILVSSDYDELIGGDGAEVAMKKNDKCQYSLEDINDDGFDDFVFKVNTQDLVNYLTPGEENELFVVGDLNGDSFAASGAYLDVIG